MHEREGAEQGLRYVYKLVDLTRLGLGAEALPELPAAAERTGFDGLNVTHPCKQVVIPLLHWLSDDARALGCRTAVSRAVEAFRLFTGVTPDVGRTLRHFAAIGTA